MNLLSWKVVGKLEDRKAQGVVPSCWVFPSLSMEQAVGLEMADVRD